MHLKSLECVEENKRWSESEFLFLACSHLVTTGNCWEGGEIPGTEVEVAVDGAGRGPVRGADDRVEVLHSRGDDVSHGDWWWC